ncbi:MAG: hypothetical protein RRY24_06695 [Clostridiales bacterium]
MKLIDYLPDYYRNISEMTALLCCEEVCFDDAKGVIKNFPLENTILKASENIIAIWEKLLGIDALGNLQQRKMFLIAMLRGIGDVDEVKIKNIVNSFTGAVDSAIVDLTDSNIRIRILPPAWGEIYLFSEIKNALLPRIPAHLSLSVDRYYRTWQDIVNSTLSWSGISTGYSSWADLKSRI